LNSTAFDLFRDLRFPGARAPQAEANGLGDLEYIETKLGQFRCFRDGR